MMDGCIFFNVFILCFHLGVVRGEMVGTKKKQKRKKIRKHKTKKAKRKRK